MHRAKLDTSSNYCIVTVRSELSTFKSDIDSLGKNTSVDRSSVSCFAVRIDVWAQREASAFSQKSIYVSLLSERIIHISFISLYNKEIITLYMYIDGRISRHFQGVTSFSLGGIPKAGRMQSGGVRGGRVCA